MTAWLRRLFHRPPTVQDCIRAALRAPCEPLNPPDPYRGVVQGPELVSRTTANRAAHEAKYRDDTGWVVVWGEFTPEDV